MLINVGDVVLEKGHDKDLGLAVGRYKDPYDGEVYIIVQWLGDESGEHCHIISCCLEVVC